MITICRPIAVDGNVVTLGFPESQGFLRTALERRQGLIEQGISEQLGRPSRFAASPRTSISRAG